MENIRIYADGACSGNQQKENTGGWGSILELGETRKELYGGEKDTTNNRMELTAVISAFEALKKDGLNVDVFTDSSYVANCFIEKWYEGWIKNGWKNSKKQDVENQELWKRLLELTNRHNVTFYRVKGHVKVPKTDDGKLPENSALLDRYKKFLEINGTSFIYSDFIHITEMNNRADELANVGVSEIK